MTESVVYGGKSSARVRVHHLQQAKERGEKWAMLTAYDTYSAAVFEEAGIPVLLVGDSSGNVVLGYSSTVPVTVDDILLMTKAVTRSTSRALIVADLPFGSYESGLLHDAGIPVMAHIGFTPQSEHVLGGYRVQGRGAGAEQLLADAHAVQEAGAFAVVLEMVPAEIAGQVTKELSIPTIGIGAGVDCDAQVLVWPDMAGLNGGRVPKFVKKYADLRGELLRATREFADEVHSGVFPGPEHSFD
jgi:3-methyl-2-oxobutanoate hydroxymethyltransferase